MKFTVENLKNKLDFGIITIRDDEYLAVFDRFKPTQIVENRRTYDVGVIYSTDGGYYTFALLRTIGQGEGIAQDSARDLIEDLHPKWLMLVGIAGAIPSTDFTLGDVVCATRIHDFCVRAATLDAQDTFAIAGGPMQKSVENFLARLPAITRHIQNADGRIHAELEKPELTVPDINSELYYGSDEWRKRVFHSLTSHFPFSEERNKPQITARPIASSDSLVKDPALAAQWLTEARTIAAIEMELAGVYLAARRHSNEYPILAIRGISDIVGFKRDEIWTQFACDIAATYALALIRTGEILPSHKGVPLSEIVFREINAWNPLVFRLFWWMCIDPEHYAKFNNELLLSTSRALNLNLACLLTWFPLMLPSLGVALGLASGTDNPTDWANYVWVGLVVVWFITGWIGRNNNIFVGIFVGIFVSIFTLLTVGLVGTIITGTTIGFITAIGISITGGTAFAVAETSLGDDAKAAVITAGVVAALLTLFVALLTAVSLKMTLLALIISITVVVAVATSALVKFTIEWQIALKEKWLTGKIALLCFVIAVLGIFNIYFLSAS